MNKNNRSVNYTQIILYITNDIEEYVTNTMFAYHKRFNSTFVFQNILA